MRMGNLALGSSSHCRVDRALEDGEVLTALGGLQVLHTPGHTPGSICLYQPASRVLFSGDLVLHPSSSSSSPALHFSVPQFSVDPDEARQSARCLLGLDIEVLCGGHGEPVADGVTEQLSELLASSG